MTLIVLLNPKQYGGAVDSSDVLDVYRKKRRQQEREEEELAVQILLDRYKELKPEQNEIPFTDLLTGALQTKYYNLDAKRQKRIQELFLMMLMEDD